MTAYCVAIDPGGTTGLAIVEQEEQPWDIRVKQLGPEEHHHALWDFLILRQPRVVICESFENRGADPAKLISPEYISIVKLYVAHRKLVAAAQEMYETNYYLRPPRVVWQSTALVTGKSFWGPSEKLRRYNLYVPSMSHARDAIRHYAYWRTFIFKDDSVLKGDIRPKVYPL